MTSMTETSAFSPAFSSAFTFTSEAMPEDVKAASERLMNLWVGAMSPLWVPFWAASSVGVGLWAVMRNLKPAEGLLAEMPVDGWSSLFRSWGLEAGELHGKAVEAVESVTHTQTSAVETSIDATETVAEAAATAMSETAAEATEVASEVANTIVETTPEVVKPAEVVTEVVAATEPKPIARSVSASRKPKTTA